MTLQAARDAAQRGAFGDARVLLEAVIALDESPEALEELGLVSWWLDDATRTFDARERAYTLYRERGDVAGAARVAIWLVWDCLAFRGDTAVSAGWLERARRLLDGREETAEYGWLLLREGEGALFRGHDPMAARDNAVRGSRLGRALGDRGLEFTGLALEGLALVSAGEVEKGMRCLDEATAAATSGEVKEMHTVGVVCCWQIFACERVRDFDRAAQWCARVREFTKRWNLRPLSAVCRTQYAGVLVWRGEWAEAESELLQAVKELEHSRPGMIAQPLARLGDLRVRQGRFEDADRYFDQSQSQSITRVGRAALLLARDRADDAAAEVDRFLAHMGTAEPTIRAGALELAARAHAAAGNLEAAGRALDELRRIASALGTDPLLASTCAAEAAVSQAVGDMAGAAACLEKAADLYERSGAPFETAQMRLGLADVLARQGQRAAAQREARGALDGFAALGAEHDRQRVRDWLDAHGKDVRSGARSDTDGLTRRQTEILRLVAQGLSNPEIARRLRLSDHTVKRHVANLLTKLGLTSRAAAAAYAARKGLL